MQAKLQDPMIGWDNKIEDGEKTSILSMAAGCQLSCSAVGHPVVQVQIADTWSHTWRSDWVKAGMASERL